MIDTAPLEEPPNALVLELGDAWLALIDVVFWVAVLPSDADVELCVPVVPVLLAGVVAVPVLLTAVVTVPVELAAVVIEPVEVAAVVIEEGTVALTTMAVVMEPLGTVVMVVAGTSLAVVSAVDDLRHQSQRMSSRRWQVGHTR